MLRRLIAAGALLLAVIGASPAASVDGTRAEATFKADAARSGFLPAGPQPPLRVRWTFRSREVEPRIPGFAELADAFSPASTHDGVVYVGARDGWIYALRARDGARIWEYQTGDAVVTGPQYSRGLVLAGSKDGFFRAFNARFGYLVWKTPFGVREWNRIAYGGMRSTPALYDGTIIMGGCDGIYRALDERTGAVIWQTDGGGPGAMSSPALWNDTIFVGHDGLRDIAFFSLEPRTGAVKWRFPVPTQIFSSPAVVDGVVYFHAREDHVYALRAADGALIWKNPATARQGSWDEVWRSPAKSSPAVDRRGVFVGIGTDLVALDRETGQMLWRAETGGKVVSSPLVVGPSVYVGSGDGNFSAFNSESGSMIWSYRAGGPVTGSATSGEGLIFVGANDGTLYAFEEDQSVQGSLK